MNETTSTHAFEPHVHRLVARNFATASDNKIHDDEVARKHGFAGGLVPGVTTYGYLLRPVVQAFGLEFLTSGRASVRLIKPVYEAESLVCTATAKHASDDRIELELACRDEAGAVRATGTAVIDRANPPQPFDVKDFPRRPLPSNPAPVSRAAIEALGELGALEFVFDDSPSLPLEIDDDNPLYREHGIAHPVLLLGAANFALAANVVMGPWIHVASEVEHYAVVRRGARLSVRPRVTRLFEKKGRELIELDLGYVVDDHEPALRVKHTAIYRL